MHHHHQSLNYTAKEIYIKKNFFKNIYQHNLGQHLSQHRLCTTWEFSSLDASLSLPFFFFNHQNFLISEQLSRDAHPYPQAPLPTHLGH